MAISIPYMHRTAHHYAIISIVIDITTSHYTIIHLHILVMGERNLYKIIYIANVNEFLKTLKALTI